MYTRHSGVPGPPDLGPSSLADDVAYYLRERPRQLPSRYLYDELGSSLFEAICHLPWYRITRTEQALLKAHGPEIFEALPSMSRVVEFGPGSGEKLLTLMAGSGGRRVALHLVDVSRAALDKASGALGVLPSVTIVTHRTTYEEGLAAVAREESAPGATLAMFLGSNIGNFDPPGVDRFLGSVRDVLCPGDALLLGTDLVKPESELLLAYDDPLGVTAAFNRNLLVRINRELGGNFDVGEFAHRAIWNADASRIEMHLVSRSRQRVRVPAADIDITLEAGEMIWTESSYKYQAADVAPVLARAGFDVLGQWVADGFALTLAGRPS